MISGPLSTKATEELMSAMKQSIDMVQTFVSQLLFDPAPDVTPTHDLVSNPHLAEVANFTVVKYYSDGTVMLCPAETAEVAASKSQHHCRNGHPRADVYCRIGTFTPDSACVVEKQ